MLTNLCFSHFRDAAEGLLSSLMEQVDFYTVYCGAESLSSTIDEINFVYLSTGEMLTMLQAAQNFRYFVLDNNILLGIYEDISRNGYEEQAKVSVILRGMSGRSAWTMQLRHLPRHKSGQKATNFNPGRPLPMDDQVSKSAVKCLRVRLQVTIPKPKLLSTLSACSIFILIIIGKDLPQSNFLNRRLV